MECIRNWKGVRIGEPEPDSRESRVVWMGWEGEYYSRPIRDVDDAIDQVRRVMGRDVAVPVGIYVDGVVVAMDLYIP